MTEQPQPARTVITDGSRPYLPRHVKLREDPARGGWTLLAPERVYTPDEIAVAVLQLCDGSRTVEGIAQQLSTSYNAPAEQIRVDVIAMLQDLADKGVVRA
jgi:pyrroloquinoline quinone biosynthesis protein D